MDQKAWHWRKRLSQKKILASLNSNLSPKDSGHKMHPSEKELSLERTLGSLNKKLESVIQENEAKDELLSTQAKMLKQAIEGQEKAEKEAKSVRQELDEALEQKLASNERLTQLNTALKESIQQLSSLREEHNQRVRDAVMKASKEFERGQKRLEEKLAEKSKNLANLILENAQLNKALVVNEKHIENLSERKSEAEMGFKMLMARLDSVEKENAFLKYEFRMLEKDLDIRNEESEFHRQSADMSHRQYMESVKKISKLENECQRLRVLVRKRFPGPIAIAKMKDNNTIQNPHGISNKKISVLIDRLCDLEGENKTLKEIIARKDGELSSSLTLNAKSTSDFSKIEAELEELSKGQKVSMQLARLNPTSKDLSPKSNFENENRNFRVSDMSLMDDFVEMEKLAIVAVDENRIDSSCRDLVPAGESLSNDNWLENVLKLILDHNHVSKTSFDDLLEDIRIALAYMKSSNPSKPNKEDPVAISGYITWKSPNRSPQKSSVNNRLNLEKPEKGLEISITDKHEVLMNQLQEAENTITYLEKEIESLKESKGEAEDRVVTQKLINEDLKTQLTVSKGKLKEVLQKLSALEVELEDRSSCYEELEGTCVELQLQLESVNKEEVLRGSQDQDEKLLKTGWEITDASTKLAQCQETIFNLGKQLKAFASQNETSDFNKKLNQRSTLHDRMLAEDNYDAEDRNSPKSNGGIGHEDIKKPPILELESAAQTENKSSAALVPSKRKGGGVGFWRKLLLRKKRGGNMKTPRLCSV